MTDVPVNLLLQARDLDRKRRRKVGQGRPVYGNSNRFHRRQNRDERQLHLVKQPTQGLVRGEIGIDRLAHGRNRGSLQRGVIRASQLAVLGQLNLQPLGADACQCLAAQCCVQDVGGDLRVQTDRGQIPSITEHATGRRRILAREIPYEQLLRFVADERPAGGKNQIGEALRVIRTGCDQPAGRVNHGDAEQLAAPRPVIGQGHAHGQLVLPAQPLSDVNGVGEALRPRRVGQLLREALDRSANGALHGRFGGERDVRCPQVTVRRGLGTRRPRRSEVQAELHAAPSAGSGCGALGGRLPAGYLNRGDRGTAVCLAQQLARRACFFASHAGQALDERSELELSEQAQDLVTVVVSKTGRLKVEVDGHIGAHRDQVTPAEDIVPVVLELEPQLLRLNVGDVVEDAVERGPVLDELGGGLLAHPGDARNVVRRVAFERLEVDHLLGLEPVALHDLGRVVERRLLNAAARRHQRGLVAHDLEQVEIARHDRRLHLAILRLVNERGDQVVRLVPLELIDRDAERLDDLAHDRKLLAQVVGHLLSRGLVLRVLLVAKGWRGEVKAGDHVVRLYVLEAA